jgi:chemotaxis protein MotB
MLRSKVAISALSLLAASTIGCGYTKEEYQLQGDKLTRAEAKLRVAEQSSLEASAELELAKETIGDLEKKMRQLGIDVTVESKPGELTASIAERERALAEYRARQAKLGEIRARLALLRGRLATLREKGVNVLVRRNALVIEIAGDAVFDGKSKLTKDGKELLTSVGELLKNEPSLAGRFYTVTGHADIQSAKSRAGAVALSTSRANAAVAFLTDPKTVALEPRILSAAGFGAEDPLDAEDSDEARKKNRRLEIVIVPNAGEHIDLRALIDVVRPAAPVAPAPVAPTTPAPAPPPAPPPKPAPPAAKP